MLELRDELGENALLPISIPIFEGAIVDIAADFHRSTLALNSDAGCDACRRHLSTPPLWLGPPQAQMDNLHPMLLSLIKKRNCH